MTLWNKGNKADEKIIKFTVGEDYLLDKELLKYDIIASIAHAKMLCKIGILNEEELKKIIHSLNEIIEMDKKGKFKIKLEDEDIHTAIENYLTKKLGETGKKIHTGRSRNDQVLVAIRLYEKEKLKETIELIDKLVKAVKNKITNNEIPGYTHMQKAMPTSIKKVFNAYISSLRDDKEIIKSVLSIIDKNPLGSGAGYGVPIELNKELTTKELGFEEVMEENYCQNSKGKYESLIIDSLVQIMMSLNKISSDLILFSMNEFEYLSLAKEMCTGSSIMPQKNNPDVLELVRGKFSVVLGYSNMVKSLYSNLISGYNRDTQLMKEPMLKSVKITKECLEIMELVFNGLEINREKCKKAMTKELYATKEAYDLLEKGMTFRDAYKVIGKKYIK